MFLLRDGDNKKILMAFTTKAGPPGQKFLKPCVNGVLKFQFFFLHLSSKVLAGVGVRTLKYPYMDICDSVFRAIKSSHSSWDFNFLGG